MAMYKCLKPCKINHIWTIVGQVVELTDKGTIDHLQNNQAIQQTVEVKSLTPEQELQKVKGVDAKVAAILIEHGVTTVDKLSAHTIDQLKEMKGIGKKTAETIFAAFE